MRVFKSEKLSIDTEKGKTIIVEFNNSEEAIELENELFVRGYRLQEDKKTFINNKSNTCLGRRMKKGQWLSAALYGFSAMLGLGFDPFKVKITE